MDFYFWTILPIHVYWWPMIGLLISWLGIQVTAKKHIQIANALNVKQYDLFKSWFNLQIIEQLYKSINYEQHRPFYSRIYFRINIPPYSLHSDIRAEYIFMAFNYFWTSKVSSFRYCAFFKHFIYLFRKPSIQSCTLATCSYRSLSRQLNSQTYD